MLALPVLTLHVHGNGYCIVSLENISIIKIEIVRYQTVVNARTIPQWLTGLIAVTVFLFLVFAAYMVNRVWNKRAHGGTSANCCKSYTVHLSWMPSEHEHAYENPIEVADNVLSTPM
uniref:Uncharacterized protein n=1 Tax=Leptobrachium leishanense TaxID=445787 RepID=A0A8C5QYS1_9ANUR